MLLDVGLAEHPQAPLLARRPRARTPYLNEDPAVPIRPATIALSPSDLRAVTGFAVVCADALSTVGLPTARWPRHDGSYPPGPGPEVCTQSESAQLVALGRALLAWPASTRHSRLDGLPQAAGEVASRAADGEAPWAQLPTA